MADDKAADERQQRAMKACQRTTVTVGSWGAMAGRWGLSDRIKGVNTEYRAVMKEEGLLF